MRVHSAVMTLSTFAAVKSRIGPSLFAAMLGAACSPVASPDPKATLRLDLLAIKQQLTAADQATVDIICADIKQRTQFAFGESASEFELNVPPCPQALIGLRLSSANGISSYLGKTQTALPADTTTAVTIPVFKSGEAEFSLGGGCDGATVGVTDAIGKVEQGIMADALLFVGRAGDYTAQCIIGGAVVHEQAFVVQHNTRTSVSLVPTAAPGIVVSPPNLSVGEGTQQSFTVHLTAQPRGQVSLSLNQASTRLQLAPSALSFNAADWNQPKTVLVNALADEIINPPAEAAVSVRTSVIASDDPAYAGLEQLSTVNIIDDEFAGVRVSGLLRTSERAGPDNQTELFFVLGVQNTQPVTLQLATSRAVEMVLSTTELTFAAGTGKTPQSVTATGIDDSADDGDQDVQINIVPNTADPQFASFVAPVVTLSNWDDEVGTPIVTGFSNGNPSNQLNFSVTGTTEPGARVENANGCLGGPALTTTQADNTGRFSLALSGIPNAQASFNLRAVNTHGYASGECNFFNYFHDSIAPAAVGAPNVVPASPGLSLTPTLSGSGAEVGASAAVFNNPTCSGQDQGSGSINGDGTYSVQVEVAAGSSTTFYVQIVDQAGNRSSCSPGVAYVHQTGSSAGTIQGPTSPGTSSTVQFDVQTTAGANVLCFLGPGCTGPTFGGAQIADTEGIASCIANLAPMDGSYQASAQVSGSGSPGCTNTVTYVRDTTPPDAINSIFVDEQTQDSITVSWDLTSDALSAFTYEVAICQGVTCDPSAGTVVSGLAETTTQHTFTSLSSCQPYVVAVRAIDAASNASGSLQTGAETTDLPATGLVAVPRLGGMELAWDAVLGSQGYEVEVRDTRNFSLALLPFTTRNAELQYEFAQGLGETVTYRVRSVGPACDTAFSAPVVVAPSQMPSLLPVYSQDLATGAGRLGQSVEIVDDLDGDGFREVAVGEPSVTTGRVEVLSGRALMQGQKVALFRLKPQFGDSSFGWSMALLPDVTGDGVRELAVGAPAAEGAGYVFDLTSRRVLMRFAGIEVGGGLGFSVARAPDSSDDDTLADVAFGAPFANGSTGTVYVVSPVDATLYSQYTNAAGGDEFGRALASGVGQGVDRLYVGAPGALGGDGQIVVYEGPAYAAPSTYTYLSGDPASTRIGESIAYLGDPWGTGETAVAIGAPGVSAVVVVNASSGTQAQVILSADASFGTKVVAAGDVANDGGMDLLVSTPAQAPGGVVQLYSFNTDLSSFVVLDSQYGPPSSGFGLGLVSRDIDGDGYPEQVIGGPQQALDAGSLRVLSVAHLPRFKRNMEPQWQSSNGYGLGPVPAVRLGMQTSMTVTDAVGAPAYSLVPADAQGAFDSFGVYSANPGLPNVDMLRAADGAGSIYAPVLSVDQGTPSSVILGFGVPPGEAGMYQLAGPSLEGLPTLIIARPNAGGGAGDIRIVDQGGSTLSARTGGAGQGLGVSAALVADYNFDGVRDVMVGSRNGNDGQIMVLSGADLSQVEIQLINGSGSQAFGASVAALPDLNGDGLEDFAVGAPNDAGGGTARGKVYILSGAGVGSPLFSIDGTTDDQHFGESLAWLGRRSSNQHDYLAVGSFLQSSASKKGRVTAVDLTAAGAIDWVLLGTNNNIEVNDDLLGYSLKGGVDFNHDGTADLIVGAPGSDNLGADRGQVLLVDGQTGAVVNARNGPLTGVRLGTSVDIVGDFNRDGFADILAGGSGVNSGRVVLFSCSNSACTASLTEHYGPGGISGPQLGCEFGATVAAVGDFNSDGRVDWTVALPKYDDSGNLGRIDLFTSQPLSAPPRVTSLSVIAAETGTEADLNFTVAAPFHFYDVRPVGSPVANLGTSAPPVTLTGLEPNTRYAVRVWSIGSSGVGLVSRTEYFQTFAP